MVTRPAARWSSFLDDAGALTLLLAATVTTIVVMPVLEDFGLVHRVAVDLTEGLTLTFGLLAVARSRIKLGILGALLVVQQALAWWAFLHAPTPTRLAWQMGISATFCWLLAAFLLGDISRGRAVTLRHIQGAIAAYLLVAIAFAFAYRGVLATEAKAFWDQNSIPGSDDPELRRLGYFSIITLTTVGYGDIVPVHPMARSLVSLEALIGQLFPAILLARLVSLEIENRRGRS